ncbi:MAG: hypothetical protein AAB368_07710, partial [bacterium]
MTPVVVVNFGTASGGPAGDLTGMTLRLICGAKTDSGMLAMTYAGVWTVGGAPRPAWTWAGSIPWGADPCADCFCAANLLLYADVGPCPADGATVELGPGYSQLTATVWMGGVVDSAGCNAPWSQVSDPDVKTIRYVMKSADKTVAAPGDAVTYTIYYGLPGTAPLNSITIF